MVYGWRYCHKAETASRHIGRCRQPAPLTVVRFGTRGGLAKIRGPRRGRATMDFRHDRSLFDPQQNRGGDQQAAAPKIVASDPWATIAL